MPADDSRLRDFWDRRYQEFTLSESGWMGAGEQLNARLYKCKDQVLLRSLSAAGIMRRQKFSVLDGGCGQGHFAHFYRTAFPASDYVGLDISERAIAHLQHSIPGAAFQVADLCSADDSLIAGTFDVVQTFDVLHLILDDDAVRRAFGNLARRVAPGGILLTTAALPAERVVKSDYLCYRSRTFWNDTIASVGFRVVADMPMFYWLPTGPEQRVARYALARLGPRVLYGLDRLALALGVAQPASAPIDSQVRLLTLRRI